EQSPLPGHPRSKLRVVRPAGASPAHIHPPTNRSAERSPYAGLRGRFAFSLAKELIGVSSESAPELHPMETPDLDLLLHRLRENSSGAPAWLSANILSRLGPPAQQVQAIFLGG